MNDEQQVTVTPNWPISFKLIYGKEEIHLNWFMIGILPVCNASEMERKNNTSNNILILVFWEMIMR